MARALESMGFDGVALDREVKWQPDVCVDVLQRDFYLLQPRQFKVIFAPPPEY